MQHRPPRTEPLSILETPGFLREVAPRVRFWKGATIGLQDTPCEQLHIVASGQVLLSRRTPKGESNAYYLLGPGDLFGEGSLTPRRRWLFDARALTDGALHILPARHLVRVAELHPELAARIITLLSIRLQMAHERLDLITTSSARDRLLRLLSLFAGAHGEPREEGLWVPLQVTQSEMGSMVGLVRETVARCLADLEARGLIRRGRGGVWMHPSVADRPESQPSVTGITPAPRGPHPSR